MYNVKRLEVVQCQDQSTNDNKKNKRGEKDTQNNLKKKKSWECLFFSFFLSFEKTFGGTNALAASPFPSPPPSQQYRSKAKVSLQDLSGLRSRHPDYYIYIERERIIVPCACYLLGFSVLMQCARCCGERPKRARRRAVFMNTGARQNGFLACTHKRKMAFFLLLLLLCLA